MKHTFLIPALAAALSTAPADAQMLFGNDPFDRFINDFEHQLIKTNVPKVDVADLKDKIEVKAELPGMDEKDINLTCSDGVLTISGEKKQSTEEKDKNYYYREISSGSFSRSIRLPQDIDDNKIEATFKNGVLTIDIPKKEVKEPTAKKITIKKG